MKYNDQAVLKTIYDKTKIFLLTRGVKGWNMDQLAAESGLAKNTLYKIIGSKENAVVGVIIRDINNMALNIKREFMDESKVNDVYTIADMFARLMATTHGDYFKEVLLEYPQSAAKIYKNKEIARETLEQFFLINKEKGIFRDDIDMDVANDIVETLIRTYLANGISGEALTNKLATSFDYLLNGILKKIGKSLFF